ncbi:MAG: GxxExxY protein [Chitinophagales bacterium]
MIHKDLIYDIIGCMFHVYDELGNIWWEAIYEEALVIALRNKGIKVAAQEEYDVFYKEKKIAKYRPDIVVEDKVIVELKGVGELTNVHKAQLISYLVGFRKPIGILADFAGKKLQKQIFPNKYYNQRALQNVSDFERVNIAEKERLKVIFEAAAEVLQVLGPGFYEEIYRRAFFQELISRDVFFETKEKISAVYCNEYLGEKWVNFFKIDKRTLVAVIAVQQIIPLLKSRFSRYLKYMNCQDGLIFNFSGTRLEYSYLKRV